MTAAALTIAQALRQARADGVEGLDAQQLLSHQLGQSRSWLLAHGDEVLPAGAAAAFAADSARLADEVPLAYLLGEQPFFGLSLQVTPAVLVPRADTEVLVRWALEVLPSPPSPPSRPSTRSSPAPATVLDLGTGSGAIGLAIAHARRDLRVAASDLSPDALAVAQGNARRLGLPLEAAIGPWWQPWAGRRFELVVSNPPYIAGDDSHLPALRHEPRLALTPEGDGLDALRAIVTGAPAGLQPAGWLLLEHGWDQADAVQALLCQAGLVDVQTRHDLAGRPRCSGGRRPAA